MLTLHKLAENVLCNGPCRVLINAEGQAVPWLPARKAGFEADIVFIRGDGWTLGAPKDLETAAFRLWADEWIGYMRRPGEQAIDIANYDGPRS